MKYCLKIVIEYSWIIFICVHFSLTEEKKIMEREYARMPKQGVNFKWQYNVYTDTLIIYVYRHLLPSIKIHNFIEFIHHHIKYWLLV